MAEWYSPETLFYQQHQGSPDWMRYSPESDAAMKARGLSGIDPNLIKPLSYFGDVSVPTSISGFRASPLAFETFRAQPKQFGVGGWENPDYYAPGSPLSTSPTDTGQYQSLNNLYQPAGSTSATPYNYRQATSTGSPSGLGSMFAPQQPTFDPRKGFNWGNYFTPQNRY